MRLISKFKDYYDSLQDPTDKHHVYVRMPLALKPEDPVSHLLRKHDLRMSAHFEWAHDRLLGQDEADRVFRDWNGSIVPKLALRTQEWGRNTEFDVSLSTELILFCGKLYRGVRYTEKWQHLRGHAPTVWRQDEGLVTKIWWNVDAFTADTRVKTRKGQEVPDYVTKEAKTFLSFAFGVEESPALMDLHFATECPVMTLMSDPNETDRHRRQLVAVLNPCLNDFQFYRALPASTAFQELSMFIGGVLANNDRPEPVDNKYKIIAHGFDLKDSFRKGPTKEHR